MTSDKTETQTPPSLAQQHLEYATGSRRTRLAELTAEEFAGFLRAHLNELYLGELRGFKPLQDVLTAQGITIDKNVDFRSQGGLDIGSISLKTQAIRTHDAVRELISIYHRTGSEEATTDEAVFRSWGLCGGYKASGKVERLVLVRPSKNSCADECLFVVENTFTRKAPQGEGVIEIINAIHLPVSEFQNHFGSKAPSVAIALICQLKSLHSTTVHELESQAKRMRQEEFKWKRLSASIM